MANYQLKAGDIMQTEVATVLGDLSVEEAVSLMRFEGTRCLLVVPRHDTEPYGIVCYSDIVYQIIAEHNNPHYITVDTIATTPAVAVRPDDSVQDIAVLFRKHGIGHAPVVNQNGVLIGVISMTDLVTEVISEPY